MKVRFTGDAWVFAVQSSSMSEHEHRVDLAENLKTYAIGVNRWQVRHGKCNCVHFTTRLQPVIDTGWWPETKWERSRDIRPYECVRCKHIERAVNYVLETAIRTDPTSHARNQTAHQR